MIEYADSVKLYDESITNRNVTIDLINKIIKSKYPNANIILFGSYAQGLSTVFSDLDFTIKVDQNIDLQNVVNILKEKFDNIVIV